MSTAEAVAVQGEGRKLAGALLVASASLIQAISVGINAVVLPTTLLAFGASKAVIGLVLAIEFVSVFAISFGLFRMLRVMSVLSWLMVSTALRLPAILLLAYFTRIDVWLLLLLVHGMGSMVFGTLLQAWINSIPFDRYRGVSMALFGTSVSLGLALGPIVLQGLYSEPAMLREGLASVDAWMHGTLGLTPADGMDAGARLGVFFSAVISTLAVVPLLFGRLLAPNFSRGRQGSLMAAFRRAPAAMFATAVCGVSIFGLQSFITVYGIKNGLSLANASLLLSAFMLGAILLEMPFGWLSDHFDRRYVMIVLVLMSLFTAVYLPIAIYEVWTARALLFAWGGVIGGLYSICLAMVADRFEGQELLAANAALSIMDAVGGMFGIVAIGIAMDLFDMDGLPYVIMFAGVLYFSFALTRYRVR